MSIHHLTAAAGVAHSRPGLMHSPHSPLQSPFTGTAPGNFLPGPGFDLNGVSEAGAAHKTDSAQGGGSGFFPWYSLVPYFSATSPTSGTTCPNSGGLLTPNGTVNGSLGPPSSSGGSSSGAGGNLSSSPAISSSLISLQSSNADGSEPKSTSHGGVLYLSALASSDPEDLSPPHSAPPHLLLGRKSHFNTLVDEEADDDDVFLKTVATPTVPEEKVESPDEAGPASGKGARKGAKNKRRSHSMSSLNAIGNGKSETQTYLLDILVYSNLSVCFSIFFL